MKPTTLAVKTRVEGAVTEVATGDQGWVTTAPAFPSYSPGLNPGDFSEDGILLLVSHGGLDRMRSSR